MYQRIIDHLETYGSITSWEAIEEYGCTRLSQYIYLARRNGVPIRSEIIRVTNRYGEKTTCNRYILEEE